MDFLQKIEAESQYSPNWQNPILLNLAFTYNEREIAKFLLRRGVDLSSVTLKLKVPQGNHLPTGEQLSIPISPKVLAQQQQKQTSPTSRGGVKTYTILEDLHKVWIFDIVEVIFELLNEATSIEEDVAYQLATFILKSSPTETIIEKNARRLINIAKSKETGTLGGIWKAILIISV